LKGSWNWGWKKKKRRSRKGRKAKPKAQSRGKRLIVNNFFILCCFGLKCKLSVTENKLKNMEFFFVLPPFFRRRRPKELFYCQFFISKRFIAEKYCHIIKKTGLLRFFLCSFCFCVSWLKARTTCPRHRADNLLFHGVGAIKSELSG
jgi:hypothetical protein